MIKLPPLFDRDRTQTVFECRRCGTTVDPETDRCPECESDDITRYEF